MSEVIHILLIEDNPGDARLIQEELQSVNSKTIIRLEWVDRLQKGLERLACNHIQAVLVDLSLPDSQGLETLQRVIQYAPQIPVIVMTGLADEGIGTRAVQSGAQDYLIKGQVDGRLLLRVVQYAIQRKQAEMKLADALEFTERILTSAPIGIFTYRLDGECVSANAYAAEMVGATIEQLRGQNFHHIQSWKVSGLYEMAQRAIATRERVADDVYIVTTFGREAWYRVQFVMFKSGGEDLLLMIFADITERKQAEAALIASERFNRATLDALTANIAILDETGTIVAVNRSWREFAQANGADPAKVSEGVNYLAVCTRANGERAEEAALIARGIMTVLEGRQESFSIEYPCHSPREKRWFIGRVTKFNGSGPVRIVVAHEYITERKLAEEALEASERRFRSWIENSLDIITVLDQSGVIQYESPSVKRVLGYQPEELNGRTAFEFIHPDDMPKVSEAFVENFENPAAGVTSEFRFRHRDGSWRVLEGSGRSYIDEHGELVGLIHSRDTTDRKQAEEAVASIQRRFQALIENAPDGIALLGTDGKLRQVTPSIHEILGYTMEEAVEQDPVPLTHPDDLPGLQALLKNLVQTPNAVFQTQFRFLHQDGTWRWLECSVSNLIQEPAVEAIVFNYRDITGRKEAEEKITLQASLLSAVGSAVIASDLEGRVLYWNPAAEALYGWTADEALGQSVMKLTTTQQSEKQAYEIFEQLTQGQSWSGEFLVGGRDGQPFPAFVTDSPLLSSDGKLIGIIGVSSDITPLKQAEAALKTSEQRYRDLAENFPNGVVSVYNQDLVMVFDAGLELKQSGYTAEHFIGKHFSELAPPETWETARPHLLAAFDGRISSYEASGLDQQYYSVSVAPLHDPGGDVHEILVVSQNITSLRNAQSALSEKERLLSDAQRIGHIGSWSYDIPGDVIRFSDEMYRLLDVAPEEFQHTSTGFLALMYPSDRVTVDNWMKDIKRGRPSKEIHFRVFHKNGEIRYIHCTGAVSLDGNGKAVRFIATVQDVTERKVAEMEIDQHIRRLTALGKIDRAIISSTDLRYTLDLILSQVLSQLHVDAASILLVDASGKMLDFAAGQGFRTRFIETGPIHIQDSHAGRAVHDRRMVRVPELRENAKDPLFSEFVLAEGFTTYIAVPLAVKGSVKGVMEVYQRMPMHPYPEWLDFLETLAGQAAIAVDNAAMFTNLQATNQELVQAYEATIEGWSRAMDLRDRETEGHTQRVTRLTLDLARAMGVEEGRLVHVRRGALLHDIGKLGVPDNILFKSGELTPEECEIMKKHTEFAYDMLSSIHYLKPALNIPYFHHERWDGSGYPLGLKGEQIPFEARIFCVIDVWDALRSDRPYRKAWESDKVKEYITEQAGILFDPNVVNCFLKMIK
jgi:PAS domain S-box-containing protein